MIDQVSVINVSEAQEGDGERQGSEFIFNCSKFFFLFLLLGQRKGGDVHGRKGFLGQSPYASACV